MQTKELLLNFEFFNFIHFNFFASFLFSLIHENFIWVFVLYLKFTFLKNILLQVEKISLKRVLKILINQFINFQNKKPSISLRFSSELCKKWCIYRLCVHWVNNVKCNDQNSIIQIMSIEIGLFVFRHE